MLLQLPIQMDMAQIILHAIALISMSTATTQMFYVLPEISSNGRCSIQPCATLAG